MLKLILKKSEYFKINKKCLQGKEAESQDELVGDRIMESINSEKAKVGSVGHALLIIKFKGVHNYTGLPGLTWDSCILFLQYVFPFSL